MNQPLRILHLEDNPADCLLVRDQLAQDGLVVGMLTVDRRADFIKALAEGKWDLILADYHLPDFTGLDALKLVRGKNFRRCRSFSSPAPSANTRRWKASRPGPRIIF